MEFKPEYRIIGKDASIKPLAYHLVATRPWASRKKEVVAIMPSSREDVVITPIGYNKLKIQVGDSIEVEVDSHSFSHYAKIAEQHSLGFKR